MRSAGDRWPELAVRIVNDDMTLEAMRQLRNKTLGTYSNDNDPVSPEAQRAWWDTGRANGSIYTALIFTANIGVTDTALAYGVINVIKPKVTVLVEQFDCLPLRNEETACLVIGVAPEARRHHLGWRMMSVLEETWRGPIVAAARLDNPAGLAMHRESAGWRETYRSETHAYYRREGW